MKTEKELLERLQKDREFAREFNESFIAKKKAGADNSVETMILVASDLGYKLTEEAIKSFMDQRPGELSEDELGKVAGGTDNKNVIGDVYQLTSVFIG